MPPLHPSGEQQLWTHVMLFWMLAHYLFLDRRSLGSPSNNPHRVVSPVTLLHASMSLAGAIGTGLLAHSWWLFAVFGITSTVMIAARTVLPEWRLWERELLVTAFFTLAIAMIIDRTSLVAQNPVVWLPLPPDRISVVCLIMALFVYTIHGGTYLVRGILRSSGVPRDSGNPPDPIELRRGLWIGAIERAILFCVVIAGSYEALGFVIAAKGLIRSRDLEANRDLTEYFLIGSLASVAVALATGIAARGIIQVLW